MNCPLCRHRRSTLFHQDRRRDYQRCLQCALVFVPSHFHLESDAEKAVYDRHQNDCNDPGYRKFLHRLMAPLSRRVKPPAHGLDFGAGPGPALARMFEEAGYRMSLYDPFYADNREALTCRYDFITSTEVVEHLREPGKTLEELVTLLKPGGLLGIMTKQVMDQEAFSRWHYIHDPTHICFYSRDTFHWLAGHHGCGLEFIGNDVVLLSKEEP